MLPDLDSNQDKQNQNLRYYRYTIGQCLKNFCDPGETRTLGPLIKSQLLYQLSYGVVTLAEPDSKFKTKKVIKN